MMGHPVHQAKKKARAAHYDLGGWMYPFNQSLGSVTFPKMEILQNLRPEFGDYL